MLGAAKVLLPPKVTEWWQAVAISIVIVAPSDNAVIFEAAPPVKETPPDTTSNFVDPPSCNCKLPVPVSLNTEFEPLWLIVRSEDEPNTNLALSEN